MGRWPGLGGAAPAAQPGAPGTARAAEDLPHCTSCGTGISGMPRRPPRLRVGARRPQNVSVSVLFDLWQRYESQGCCHGQLGTGGRQARLSSLRFLQMHETPRVHFSSNVSKDKHCMRDLKKKVHILRSIQTQTRVP